MELILPVLLLDGLDKTDTGIVCMHKSISKNPILLSSSLPVISDAKSAFDSELISEYSASNRHKPSATIDITQAHTVTPLFICTSPPPFQSNKAQNVGREGSHSNLSGINRNGWHLD
jgi:hypothetical protein